MRRVITFAVLLLVALSMLLPFAWMAMTSFMDELEIFRFPPKFIPDRWLFQNYAEIFLALPFARFFLNSFVMSAGIAIAQLVFCSLAAYAFARCEFPGRDKIFIVYLSFLMVPLIVVVIPRFLLVSSLGWVDTFAGLIVPEMVSVWGIFLLRQFFQTLPRDLEDAARIDGASDWQIYRKIVLPLSVPALATLGIFAFVGSWQSFLWPLLATRSLEMRPVEVGIANFHSLYIQKWPQQMAAATVAVVPLLIVFFLAQRYFVRGIALTGMKG